MPFAQAVHLLSGWLGAPLSSLTGESHGGGKERVWAVLDVSFSRLSLYKGPEDVDSDEVEPLAYLDLNGDSSVKLARGPSASTSVRTSRLSCTAATAPGSTARETDPATKASVFGSTQFSISNDAGKLYRFAVGTPEEAAHWVTYISDAIALSGYIRDCGSLKVSPLDEVLLCLRTHIQVLSLTSKALYLGDVIALERLLGRQSSTIRTVSLNDCSLNDATIAHLAPCLQTSNITTLSLESNRISNGGLVDLCTALSVNINLVHLSLARNDIGDEGIPGLCDVLSSHVTLEHLDLSYNFIGIKAVELMAQTLPQSALKHLNLSGNDISDAGVQALCEHALGNSQVTSLSLRQCGLTDQSALALAGVLVEERNQGQPLQHLDIEGNSIGDAGFASLRRGVALAADSEHGFTSIRLGGASVTIQAARDLAHLLSKQGRSATSHDGARLSVSCREDGKGGLKDGGKFYCSELRITRQFVDVPIEEDEGEGEEGNSVNHAHQNT